jgi:4-alpha-glucanotransferase
MADWGIWSYQVMMFERDDHGRFRGIDHYASNALVTFNTHDLSTYAGWRSFSDLALKRSLGLDPGESDDARWHALAMLDDVLRQNAIDRNDVFSVLNFLAQTKSRLLAISLEDILGVVDQPNIPGTVNEHPNWRRRLPVPIDQMKKHLESSGAFRAVLIQATESSTGVRNDVETLGRAVASLPECCFVVDAITGMGTTDLRPDEWGIDIMIGGSQKATMIPPGLAFASVSDRAA